jgi:predicted O-methyltransferase YrrM
VTGPVIALASATAVLALGLGAALSTLARHYRERRQRGLLGPWPIPKVQADALDARFEPGPLGAGRETEIAWVPSWRVPGAVGDFESWILCTLARGARQIFEFGTGTGKTTYLLARNAPEARVTTLTIAPGTTFDTVAGDAPEALAAAAAEAFDTFYYEGTPCAARIEQLVGDSMAFDETPWEGRCDLVFVDGGHARSHVENDTAKALRMAKPGGWVVWHDYRGPKRAAGVFQTLNALARTHALRHVAGTSLVVWRRPDAPAGAPSR